MAQIKKLVAQIRNNPLDVRFNDLGKTSLISDRQVGENRKWLTTNITLIGLSGQ